MREELHGVASGPQTGFNKSGRPRFLGQAGPTSRVQPKGNKTGQQEHEQDLQGGGAPADVITGGENSTFGKWGQHEDSGTLPNNGMPTGHKIIGHSDEGGGQQYAGYSSGGGGGGGAPLHSADRESPLIEKFRAPGTGAAGSAGSAQDSPNTLVARGRGGPAAKGKNKNLTAGEGANPSNASNDTDPYNVWS